MSSWVDDSAWLNKGYIGYKHFAVLPMRFKTKLTHQLLKSQSICMLREKKKKKKEKEKKTPTYRPKKKSR